MAKSARQSSDGLFSVSASSEILGRSRRTISHALQGVKPDAIRSGLKLWKMKRIVEAINSNTQAPILTSSAVSGELQALFDQLNEADARMRRMESLKDRRAFARQTLLPLLHEVDREMRLDGKQCGELEMLTGLRCDQHLRVFLVAGLGPDATGGCDWTHDEAWSAYNAAGDDGEEDEAA
jgi:hypothetical protein